MTASFQSTHIVTPDVQPACFETAQQFEQAASHQLLTGPVGLYYQHYHYAAHQLRDWLLRTPQPVAPPASLVAAAQWLQQAPVQYCHEWGCLAQSVLQRVPVTLPPLDGKQLDAQQQAVVLQTAPSALVLAGAGSGKTFTLAGRIRHLVETQHVDPKDILVLSFTAASAEELQHRVCDKLGLPVEIKTFHKLGLEILAAHRRQKPNVCEEHVLRRLIETHLIQHTFQDEATSHALIEHFSAYLKLKKAPDTPTLREFFEYRLLDKLRHLSIESLEDVESMALTLSSGHKTLQHEYVKSVEEMKIANYLFLHGIDYQYETPYPFPTADAQHRQYKPDFFLPNYHIYLEHFGIDETGDVRWLSEQAAKTYQAGIDWKRQIHQRHQTHLVETYSYQTQNQELLSSLRQQLESRGVQFKRPRPFEVLERLLSVDNQDYEPFITLIQTFIQVCKANHYTSQHVAAWCQYATAERDAWFYSIVTPIFYAYEQHLVQHEEVDFTDMITQAIALLQSQAVVLSYRHVIVDEYQDISALREQLLHVICEQTQATFLAVGDDWQSIYRFAGSDLQLFRQRAAQSTPFLIETTYRNPQPLLDIAGAFVMNYPAHYRKHLKSAQPSGTACPVQLYEYQGQHVLAGLKQAIVDIVNQYGPTETIYLIGRYHRDLPQLDDTFEWQQKGDQKVLHYAPYPQLKLQFMTAHKAKGLECDHVIGLNNKDAKLGFPSQIQSEPLLAPFLPMEESDFAEERRLFYVLLTRAKKSVRLLIPAHRPSCFIQELQQQHHVPLVWREPSVKFYQVPTLPVAPHSPVSATSTPAVWAQ